VAEKRCRVKIRAWWIGVALLGLALSLPRAAPGAAPPQPMPRGADTALIGYGKVLLEQTPRYLGSYITARMACSACHLDAGTRAHGGSFVGTYAMFPQWNARAHRFITLQDRLAECFLYSMNGRPPAYDSREMVALTAYIAYLSRGTIVGTGRPDQGFVTLHAAHAGDPVAGELIYRTRCISCHGANGDGGPAGAAPPLWGPYSFNSGAGMNRKMAAFVRAVMPLNAPGSLSDQQATDVAAFVLLHPRPQFDPKRTIVFPPRPAGAF
jgi:thiosulfate dehydrogenase